jgi:protein-disulfide isomerase
MKFWLILSCAFLVGLAACSGASLPLPTTPTTAAIPTNQPNPTLAGSAATPTQLPPADVALAETSAPILPDDTTDWLTVAGQTTDGRAYLGNSNAPVTMIDYSDFL